MDSKQSTGMSAVRWTLAVGILGLLPAPADAALCVKRSGVVFARAACKPKEAVLNADVFSGSQGPAGAAGTKGDKGDKGDKGEPAEPPGFRVVDSGGRQIGRIDDYSDMTVVAPTGAILNLTVGPEGFEPDSSGPTLYHEGANCSGPSFIARYPGDGFVHYPDVYASIAYYAGDPVIEHSFISYEYPAPTCATPYTPRGFCCENSSQPFTYDAGPVRTYDLSSLGTPPLSIVK